MIRLAAQDREAAVELFEEEEADEAVGDGDAAERDEAAGPGAEGGRVAVGAADGEHDGGAGAVELFGAEQGGEVVGGHQVAALVEDVEVGVRGHRGGQGGVVLVLGDRGGAVAPEALEVVRLGLGEVGLLEAADDGDGELQYRSSSGRRASSGTSMATRGASIHRPSRS